MQIVVNNSLTSYNELGDKNNPFLLILPGWRRTSTEWLSIAKKFERKYRVFILDFPGFGATPQPAQDWDTYDFADFTKAFLEKLGIGKCTLLGHSFGGRVGIILASSHFGKDQNLIQKLILVDSAGYEKKNWQTKVKLFIIKKILKPIKLLFKGKFHENVIRLMGSPDYKSAGQMKPIFIKIVNQDLSHLMPRIKCPTVIIWGENDDILSIRRAKIMKKLIPNSLLRVVWGAGHNPHLEKPEQFMQILNEYLL